MSEDSQDTKKIITDFCLQHYIDLSNISAKPGRFCVTLLYQKHSCPLQVECSRLRIFHIISLDVGK